MVQVGDVALARRSLISRVVHAVRDLGAATSLDEALQSITDHVVDLLDFDAAALNVLDAADGDLVVRAVSGPVRVRELVGSRASRDRWRALLDRCVRDGDLYFLDHRQQGDPAVVGMPASTAEDPGGEVPEGVWHVGDSLLVPVHDVADDLLAVLSVDLSAGTVDDVDHRTALSLFAAEAGSTMLEWAARDEAGQALAVAENRFRLVWDNGLVGASVIDETGVIIDVNEQAATTLGWPREELIGRLVRDVIPDVNQDAARRRFDDLMDSRGRWVEERQLRTRDGRILWTLMHATTGVEGTPPRPVLITQWIDISAQREHADLLAHQLEHDLLTNLPNRLVLERQMASLFAAERGFGILYADIDGFKGVVDALGQAAADALIVQVGERLRGAMAPGALLVRLAGDEFVVLVEGVDHPDDLAAHAVALTASLADPFDLDGAVSQVQMSIGVSGTRDWHGHPVDVLREADEALQRAKRRGRARVEVFDPGYDQPVTRADLELEQDLRRALESKTSLEPHFQSVISLTSGATVGYESLLRWRHPRLGVLLPDRFIPVADRAGLSSALGWRVLDLVAERVPPVVGNAGRPWIAVNVSAAQLGRGSLLHALRRVIDTTFRDSPSDLHLEITETSLLDASPAVIDELYAAVELGARLSLDDFGTGYSSLTLLRDLPVSSIKIDRSFIAPIAVDIRARTIVQHTIELCQGLGMTTIAEGVETHEQLAWLQTLGCEYGQGFLIDRPNPWPRFDVVPSEERRRFEF